MRWPTQDRINTPMVLKQIGSQAMERSGLCARKKVLTQNHNPSSEPGNTWCLSGVLQQLAEFHNLGLVVKMEAPPHGGCMWRVKGPAPFFKKKPWDFSKQWGFKFLGKLFRAFLIFWVVSGHVAELLWQLYLLGVQGTRYKFCASSST